MFFLLIFLAILFLVLFLKFEQAISCIFGKSLSKNGPIALARK